MTTRTRPRNLLPTTCAAMAVIVFAAACAGSGSENVATSAAASAVASADAPPSAPPTPPSATPAPLPDPCTLLTLPEAKSLAGTTLSPGQDVPSADPVSPASCTYTAPPTASSGQVELYVSLAVPRAYQIDQAVKHRFRTVPGIGDETVEEPDNNNIFIRKGQMWVYLSIPFGATPAVMERAARLIAARMP